MMAAVVTEGIAIVLLAILVGGLLRSHAEILQSLHELGAGIGTEADRHARERDDGPAAVPVTIDGRPSGVAPGTTRAPATASQPPAAIVGTTPDGQAAAVPLLGGQTDVLIAFLSSGCASCRTFWDTFAAGRMSVPGGARLVVVTQDADAESESALRALQPDGVPVILSSATWEALGVPGSPYFAYVDTGGHVVGEGTGAGWPQVVSLLTQAEADRDRDREHGPGPGTTRARRGTRARRQSDDDLLRDAGITPGDPRLYPGAREVS
ncbi:MAG: hypothetical protein QOF57_1622 [Frankiaceae bacterium]|nr:hypothetical protein [Frankiaceae bacterium]